jgi:hypothetical protein
MTRLTAGRLLPLALLLALLGGCTYFPTIRDTGGPRLEPRNGRLLRVQGGAICYFDLDNTGKYEDTLVAAESRIARRVEILTAAGAGAGVVMVPGESRVVFDPGGLRIMLSELTQELKSGDGVIVTLIFEKSGRIGVVSLVE